jgi:hypothetical protein
MGKKVFHLTKSQPLTNTLHRQARTLTLQKTILNDIFFINAFIYWIADFSRGKRLGFKSGCAGNN